MCFLYIGNFLLIRLSLNLMTIQPNSIEFNVLFWITIIVLIVKALLSVFLGYKIYQRKKDTGQFSFGFIFSVLIMMLCLFFSRLLYFQFDFFLTKFNPNEYYQFPNVFYWKFAVLISAIGYATVLFTIDRTILSFKFKGILAYVIILVSLVVLFFPVDSSADFRLVSGLLFVINIIAIMLPVLFFYIGFKAEQYKKPSFLIAIAVILYAVGANIINEAVLAFFADLRIFMYFIALILKATGLILYSYSVTQFVQIFSD